VEVVVGRLMAGNAIWLLEGGESAAETEEAVAEEEEGGFFGAGLTAESTERSTLSLCGEADSGSTLPPSRWACVWLPIGPTTVGVILFRLLVELDREAEEEAGIEVVEVVEVAVAVAVSVSVMGFKPSCLISPTPESVSLVVPPLLGGSSGVSVFTVGSAPITNRALGSWYWYRQGSPLLTARGTSSRAMGSPVLMEGEKEREGGEDRRVSEQFEWNRRSTI
jgi:hypothetical protein